VNVSLNLRVEGGNQDKKQRIEGPGQWERSAGGEKVRRKKKYLIEKKKTSKGGRKYSSRLENHDAALGRNVFRKGNQRHSSRLIRGMSGSKVNRGIRVGKGIEGHLGDGLDALRVGTFFIRGGGWGEVGLRRERRGAWGRARNSKFRGENTSARGRVYGRGGGEDMCEKGSAAWRSSVEAGFKQTSAEAPKAYGQG